MKKGDGCDVQVSRPKSLRVGPPSLPLRRAGTPGPRGRVAQGNPAPRLLRVGSGAPGQLAPSRAQPAPASPPAPVRPRPRRRSPSPSRRAAGAAPRSSRARGRRGSCSCPRPDPGADQQRAAAEAAAAAAAGRGGSAVGRRPPGARACDRRAPAPRSPSPRSRGARPAALGPGPSGLAQVDSPLKDADSILRSRTTSRKKGPSPRLQGCFPPGGPTGLFSQTAGVSNLSFRHPCIGGELCGPARFPHWLENMKVLLRLVCLIAVLISSLEADMCEERAERVILVSSAYEIDVRSCLLNPNERKGTIIWYKNDSKTPVSMEVDSRIHQHEDKLWFVPAKVEDSGHYYCAVRNSTYCLKVKITIKFVQHEPNLCYNTEAIFTQKLPVAADGQLVCPYMEFFKDEKNGLPEMQWHKDCKPLHLDNINFTGVTDRLIIANVTAAHEGKYTCGTFYTYLGKRYPITRVIELITIEEYKPVRPVIVSPANETMEAGLGSKLQLICNVSGHISDYVYWKWNGSSIDEEDSVLAEDYVPVENPPKRRKNTIITILNISEVESRFYLHPFTCVAKNTEGLSSAYIQLIHPVPDFRKHTIGVFVMLTVIITCSVFIYKIFKVDIVLWYRDSCYVLPKKASDGKTYDAYILYPKTPGEGSTSNSDIFVFKVLPEVLEEQCGYKLFIYGRDAYVGEDIVEVTNENIRKSRRLIIVLVPEASGLGCLGNSSEEQIAMYNAFVQDGIKVVLLELEKIQDYEKMPETIKFIKQKHGAIRWSGDFREGSQSAKTRFWKNVRYHMPVQRQPPSSRPQFLSLATRPDSKKTLQREVQVPLG